LELIEENCDTREPSIYTKTMSTVWWNDNFTTLNFSCCKPGGQGIGNKDREGSGEEQNKN
jgi:hypothetical protein